MDFVSMSWHGRAVKSSVLLLGQRNELFFIIYTQLVDL